MTKQLQILKRVLYYSELGTNLCFKFSIQWYTFRCIKSKAIILRKLVSESLIKWRVARRKILDAISFAATLWLIYLLLSLQRDCKPYKAQVKYGLLLLITQHPLHIATRNQSSHSELVSQEQRLLCLSNFLLGPSFCQLNICYYEDQVHVRIVL